MLSYFPNFFVKCLLPHIVVKTNVALYASSVTSLSSSCLLASLFLHFLSLLNMHSHKLTPTCECMHCSRTSITLAHFSHTHADTQRAAELTHTHAHAGKRLSPCFLLFLIPYVRAELNRVLDVWVVFLCPKRLTNCCCPEQKQPLHCLSICAQPYQRFNTYCFKLHQSLPPLPSPSPPSPGSFFSVSFYYFASSSFSPLTSLHIIPALVAFSSSSHSPSLPSLPLLAPICFIFSSLSLFPPLKPSLLPLSCLFSPALSFPF